MYTIPDQLVLDCTVTVPWYLTDEANPLTEALIDAWGRCQLLVPVLWRLEFVSALQAAVKRGRIPAARMPSILSQAARLPLQQQALSLDIVEIANGAAEHQLNPYDYVYFALARQRGVPLATQDRALIRACRAAGVGVLTHPMAPATVHAAAGAKRPRPLKPSAVTNRTRKIS